MPSAPLPSSVGSRIKNPKKWNSFPLENLKIAQTGKKYLACYETQESLLCSQLSITGHYPKPPDFSSLCKQELSTGVVASPGLRALSCHSSRRLYRVPGQSQPPESAEQFLEQSRRHQQMLQYI